MRETYFPDDVLKDISGRLRFGASKIEDKVAELRVPKPNPFTPPAHPMDKTAKLVDMTGYELSALEQAAERELENNPMLLQAYRQYMMIAKLCLPEALEKVRKQKQEEHETKARRERKYVDELRNYEAKKANLETSWENVRSTVRTRWNRITKSLLSLVKTDPNMANMAPRDLALIGILAQKGKVTITDDQVTWVNMTGLADFSIEEIDEVIELWNQTDAGQFKDKLQKFKI